MTIKALPAPCFIEAGQRDGNHSEHSESFDNPSELPEPCYLAVCDGIPGKPCGEVLGDVLGEYDEGHYESAEDAVAALRDEGWEWLPVFAAVRCQQCTDELTASVPVTEGAAS